MPRSRRNCRRDSISSDISDVDNVPFLESANICSKTKKRNNRQTTKRRGIMKKSAAPKIPRDVNNTVIILDDSDDDCVSTVISRSRTIDENVKNKVENIFKSSGLFSDDEDETPQLNTTKTKQNDNISSSININEPSSSTCNERVAKTTTSDRVVVVADDLNEINTIEDIKNYCEETEDILKNANAILERYAGITIQVEPTEQDNPDNKENAIEQKKLECPICYDSLSEKQAMTTKCGHLFCKPCIEQVISTIKKCPTCRKAVNKRNVIPIYL